MAVSGACWGTHALSVARQFWRGGCSSATGCWATNCKTPGVAGARPRGAWLQGGSGIRSPLRFRPGGNCRISGSFSWLLPFSGLLGRAVPWCAAGCFSWARALGLPGAVGLLGGWRGGVWGRGSVVRPPGAAAAPRAYVSFRSRLHGMSKAVCRVCHVPRTNHHSHALTRGSICESK